MPRTDKRPADALEEDENGVDNNTTQSKPRKRRNDKPEGVPSRPLSSYNIFFKYERVRLMQEKAGVKERHDSNDNTNVESAVPASESIGFQMLAKTVGQRWKSLSAQDRAPYEELARIETIRYTRDKRLYELQMVEQLRSERIAAAALATASSNEVESTVVAETPSINSGGSRSIPNTSNVADSSSTDLFHHQTEAKLPNYNVISNNQTNQLGYPPHLSCVQGNRSTSIESCDSNSTNTTNSLNNVLQTILASQYCRDINSQQQQQQQLIALYLNNYATASNLVNNTRLTTPAMFVHQQPSQLPVMNTNLINHNMFSAIQSQSAINCYEQENNALRLLLANIICNQNNNDNNNNPPQQQQQQPQV